MENKLPTAEEFYDKSKHDSILDIMIEFAKLHCAEQAKVIYEKSELWEDISNGYSYQTIKKDSILNAYNLDEIV